MGTRSNVAVTMNSIRLQELLLTRPHEYKRCKLKLERDNLAYARVLDEPGKVIIISGAKHVGRSLPGDEVCVQILIEEHHLVEEWELSGRVVGLLKRSEENPTLLCRLSKNNQQLVTPLRKNMPDIKLYQKKRGTIEIRRFNKSCKLWIQDELEDITEDQLLVVKVLKWEDNYKYPLGVVTRVVPQDDHWKETLALEFGVTEGPPSGIRSKTEPSVPDIVGPRNFCKATTFTVDHEGTEDVDDAISVKVSEETYEIGIHITDVASRVRRNDDDDAFAQRQGRTLYYPGDKKKVPAFMFSRSLSEELSLVPHKGPQKTISLIMVMDKSFAIRDSYLTLSLVSSNYRLTYDEADDIIQRYLSNGRPEGLDVNLEECVAVAYRFAKVHRRCRLQGGWSSGLLRGESRAHCMVEELMNLYNSQVAERLLDAEATRALTPLKCHLRPNSCLLEDFRRKFSALLPLSLHLLDACEADGAKLGEGPGEGPGQGEGERLGVDVLVPVFQEMEALSRSGDHHRLLRLIVSDDIHPTLRPMAKQFMEIQEKAWLLRSCSTRSSRLGHFGLQLNAYTSASSPMRRYLDLVLQRLLHGVLRNEPRPEYSKCDIEELCEEDMENSECAAYFDVDEAKFVNDTKSGSTVMTKLAIVERLDPERHVFAISLLLDRSPPIHIMYRNLKVVEQPEYNAESGSMTLRWKRRVYSFSDAHKPPAKPYKNVVSVSAKIWKEMISAVRDEDWSEVHACLKRARKADKKPDTSLPGADPKSHEHFKNWTLELKLGEVLQVQPGTEVMNGGTAPTVDLLDVDPSFQVCVEHARNRIKCFAKVRDDCETSKPHYRDVREYQKIWSKLCKMDTAYNAVEENNSVILEGVSITWTSGEELGGYIQMTQEQKREWSLEFDLTNCFLCIRLRVEHDKPKGGSGCSELPDLQRALPFTWVAHGVPMSTPEERQENKGLKQTVVKIHFRVNHQNTESIPQKVHKRGTKFTVEVIPKKIPFMLHENAVANLKHANDLVKSIAIGTPPWGNPIRTQQQLVLLDSSFDLPPLNMSQKEAVQKALQNPFTVIQGPPGTGKTVVGVNITYQFHMKNKQAEGNRPEPPNPSEDKKKPKKYGILYCGPSNKAVDTVAEQLLKVRRELRPLRIHCDQMEMITFPYPGSDLKLCRKSYRDEEPKEELREISLMYLIRKPDNPHSEEIYSLEKGLEEFDTERYRKVLRAAQEHELRKHHVVLCTCSTALKPVLRETMDFKQIIIDECAMATEPEAFIPLVSHNPEQIVLLGDHKQTRPIVSCARVKEHGMETSLFERYMTRALMLDTQYRMHKSICEFPSTEFYEGRLKTGTQTRPLCLLDAYGIPTGTLFAHVEGEEVSLVVSTNDGNENSVANQKEAVQAVRVAELLITDSGVKPEDIAILTPYNTQVVTIKKILEKKRRGVKGINVCTVMKSQGSEWPFVIISTVRSCPLNITARATPRLMKRTLGFVCNPNLVNVALTRAQQGLCILGNRDLLEFSDLWRNLIHHYMKKNCVLNSAQHIRVQ